MDATEIRAAIAADPALQALVPGATLDHPAQALAGFDGVWWDMEIDDPRPVAVRAIVVGAWMLALGATAWAAGRLWRKRNG